MSPHRLSPLNRMLNLAPCLLLAVLAAGPEVVELDLAALTWWLNISWIVAPVVAGLLCLRVAGASSGRSRRAWRHFAAGSFFWAVGSVIYAWYDLRGYPVPFPGYADIFFIASCVASAAGMFCFGSPEGQAGRIQVCNFALVLCSSAISGFVLLFPQLRASTVGSLGTLVAFISPALWLGTSIFGVLCLILYAPRRNRFSFALLIAGIIGHAVADNIYGLARLDRSYSIGVSFDWIWGASFLAIAAAATSRTLQLRSTGERAFVRAGTVLPRPMCRPPPSRGCCSRVLSPAFSRTGRAIWLRCPSPWCSRSSSGYASIGCSIANDCFVSSRGKAAASSSPASEC
jgi:hypothetical protein